MSFRYWLFGCSRRGRNQLSRKDIEKHLNEVAFLREIAVKEELSKFIDALELEHGVLIEWTRNIFVFPHRTFQEYLAAWYIERSRGEKVFAVHLKTRYSKDLERWREVAIILAFLLYDASEYVTSLMNNALGYDFKQTLLPEILIQDISCNSAVFDWARERGYLNSGR